MHKGLDAASYCARLFSLCFCVGMKNLGFELYLPSEKQGYIISSYRYPKDSNWNFNRFYNLLNDRGFAIYPGKV
jgi:2-aminoethylphosphonate-pyruvate transaminase